MKLFGAIDLHSDNNVTVLNCRDEQLCYLVSCVSGSDVLF